MELIEKILGQYSLSITGYAVLITFGLIIIVSRDKSKKNKYLDWKKDTLILPLFKREWERNDDKVLQELYDENQALHKRVKELDKDVNKLSLFALLMIFLMKIGAKK
ncbi:MAG: hypothetical protein PHT07_03895 [Paludibacter sp.]|nr:hypothetical protein [Paludibacter sp.]